MALAENEKTLSVIIPVFNEEKTVLSLLDKVRDARLSLKKEVIIVNDGSTDASPEIIKKWVEQNPASERFQAKFFSKDNGGKGSAVREGIINSSGDIVIIQDADLEYDPEDYQSCVNPILNGECKVVYGSRELYNRNRIYSSPSFYLGGLVLTYWMNLLYGSDLTDEPTCYKVFDGGLVRALLFKGDKFEWEPEITAKLLRLGYGIKEVTISYKPRKINEGKKIKWTDGFMGLWEALYWRFASIAPERKRLLSVSSERGGVLEYRSKFYAMVSIVALAVIIRVLFALPGMSEPEKLLFRPDTGGYLNPALSMLENGAYNTSPDSGVPALVRVPGYSAYLAVLLFLSGNSLWFCAAASCLLGALICVPVFYSGDYFGNWRVGALASLLFAMNITAVALSPMFLSDTLFAFLVAVQLYFFMRFYYSRILLYLIISIAFASLGALVRPLNQFWILPCLVLIFLGSQSLKGKITAAVFSVLVFCSIVCPWMLRNNLSGGGWRLDAISGEVLFHNGAVLLSRTTGEDQGAARARLYAEAEEEFRKKPELYRSEAERISWKEKRFMEMIRQAPLTYLLLHFRAYSLLPDVPSLLQNMGVTTGEKGTFDVMSRDGVLAGARHYFKGKRTALLMAAPFVLVVAVTYFAAGVFLLWALVKRNWFVILSFLAFVEFYIFVPGPVGMPRYQLPALPLVCIFAAAFILMFKKHVGKNGFRLRKLRPEDNV